jgi:hypothetical protein
VKILGFSRVELMLAPDEIEQAAKAFNDLLGTSFGPPHIVSNGEVLTTTDWANHVELFGPAKEGTGLAARYEEKGRGAIGPLVWEVDDIDEARRHAGEKGYDVVYEYEDAETGIKQIILDEEQCFGYRITFMQRPR